MIGSCRAKYIPLPCNTMVGKGNGRSNAKISDADIRRALPSRGTVKVFEEGHWAFAAGKSDISENAERLFLCACFDKEEKDGFLTAQLHRRQE